MLGVTTDSWCVASVSVGAPDELDLLHDARPRWIDGLEEEPGDSVGFGRCALLQEIAFDGTAILRSPDRTRTVSAHGTA